MNKSQKFCYSRTIYMARWPFQTRFVSRNKWECLFTNKGEKHKWRLKDKSFTSLFQTILEKIENKHILPSWLSYSPQLVKMHFQEKEVLPILCTLRCLSLFSSSFSSQLSLLRSSFHVTNWGKLSCRYSISSRKFNPWPPHNYSSLQLHNSTLLQMKTQPFLPHHFGIQKAGKTSALQNTNIITGLSDKVIKNIANTQCF